MSGDAYAVHFARCSRGQEVLLEGRWVKQKMPLPVQEKRLLVWKNHASQIETICRFYWRWEEIYCRLQQPSPDLSDHVHAAAVLVDHHTMHRTSYQLHSHSRLHLCDLCLR